MAIRTETLTGLEQGTYTLDAAHTGVTFTARHMMVAKVRGRFGSVGGSVHVDADPTASTVQVEIDAASIDTGVEQRDGHLRSDDFLGVDRFPVISFRSTALEVTGDDTFDVHGELTIRDVTKPVVLHATFEGVADHPQTGKRAGFSASAQIDREDWGMTWNQALEAGGWLVGRTIRIDIDAEVVPEVG